MKQNLKLIANINFFQNLGYQLVIGASRKGFLGQLIAEPIPRNRIFANLSIVAWAAIKNVDIIRVHDVKPTFQFLKVFNAINKSI